MRRIMARCSGRRHAILSRTLRLLMAQGSFRSTGPGDGSIAWIATGRSAPRLPARNCPHSSDDSCPPFVRVPGVVDHGDWVVPVDVVVEGRTTPPAAREDRANGQTLCGSECQTNVARSRAEALPSFRQTLLCPTRDCQARRVMLRRRQAPALCGRVRRRSGVSTRSRAAGPKRHDGCEQAEQS